MVRVMLVGVLSLCDFKLVIVVLYSCAKVINKIEVAAFFGHFFKFLVF